MKDYIARHYPDQSSGKQYTYDQLHVQVKEAWDSITPQDLIDQIDLMKERCEAVIKAKGGHTKY
jgi:hypothetical protein